MCRLAPGASYGRPRHTDSCAAELNAQAVTQWLQTQMAPHGREPNLRIVENYIKVGVGPVTNDVDLARAPHCSLRCGWVNMKKHVRGFVGSPFLSAQP